MRRFSLGSAADRKVVVVEIRGATLSVIRLKPDGTSSKQEQTLSSEAAAKDAGEKLAQELSSRGYIEHGKTTEKTKRASSTPTTAQPRTVRTVDAPAPVSSTTPENLFDDLDVVEEASEPVLSRLVVTPAVDSTVRTANKTKKKKGAKKKGKKSANPDALDKRVLAAVVGVGLLLIAGVGYIAYDMFLKPATVVGVWKGSMVEHEIGRSLSRTQYALTLDDAKNASLSINASSLAGTYEVKGNRLFLTLKDEDGTEFRPGYRIKLGHATMSLIDPDTDNLLVDLVRQLREPAAERSRKVEIAKDLVDDGDLKADPDGDRALAAIEFGAKDGAFKIRHPAGWKSHTGGRPDNTYSYIHLEKDPFKISVYADITGSLISGSDSTNPGDFPEGSDFAPVHKAHEHFTQTGVDDFSGYQEGTPELFKETGMGEGRIAVFTASAGMFGGKLKGYHATMLTQNRRISVLAYGPEEDFIKLRATYLAVCRSVSP